MVRKNPVLRCEMNLPKGDDAKSALDVGFDSSRKAFLSKTMLSSGAALLSFTQKSYADSGVAQEANKETLIMKTTAGTMTFEFWPEVICRSSSILKHY